MIKASELPNKINKPSDIQIYAMLVSLFNYMVTSYDWETETESKRELAETLNDWLEKDCDLMRIDFES